MGWGAAQPDRRRSAPTCSPSGPRWSLVNAIRSPCVGEPAGDDPWGGEDARVVDDLAAARRTTSRGSRSSRARARCGNAPEPGAERPRPARRAPTPARRAARRAIAQAELEMPGESLAAPRRRSRSRSLRRADREPRSGSRSPAARRRRLALALWHHPRERRPRSRRRMSVAAMPARPSGRPLGWWGMVFVIATEATLFAVLLASYFYLRFKSPGAWPPDGIADPKLLKPAVMTAPPDTSSLTVWYGERAVRRDDCAACASGSRSPSCSGSAFLVLQVTEYRGAARESTRARTRTRRLLHDHRPARRPRRRRPARCSPGRSSSPGAAPTARAHVAVQTSRSTGTSSTSSGCSCSWPSTSPAADDGARRRIRGSLFAVLGAAARLGGAARRRLRDRGGRAAPTATSSALGRRRRSSAAISIGACGAIAGSPGGVAASCLRGRASPTTAAAYDRVPRRCRSSRRARLPRGDHPQRDRARPLDACRPS